MTNMFAGLLGGPPNRRRKKFNFLEGQPERDEGQGDGHAGKTDA